MVHCIELYTLFIMLSYIVYSYINREITDSLFNTTNKGHFKCKHNAKEKRKLALKKNQSQFSLFDKNTYTFISNSKSIKLEFKIIEKLINSKALHNSN